MTEIVKTAEQASKVTIIDAINATSSGFTQIEASEGLFASVIESF